MIGAVRAHDTGDRHVSSHATVDARGPGAVPGRREALRNHRRGVVRVSSTVTVAPTVAPLVVENVLRRRRIDRLGPDLFRTNRRRIYRTQYRSAGFDCGQPRSAAPLSRQHLLRTTGYRGRSP